MAYTSSNLPSTDGLRIVGRKYVVPWTSSAGGAYTETIPLRGFLVKVTTNPGATAPTDNYDLTLLDSDGVDVLGGLGVDRDTANSETIPTPGGGTSLLTYVDGDHTFTIANAGNAKDGSATLYVLNPT